MKLITQLLKRSIQFLNFCIGTYLGYIGANYFWGTQLHPAFIIGLAVAVGLFSIKYNIIHRVLLLAGIGCEFVAIFFALFAFRVLTVIQPTTAPDWLIVATSNRLYSLLISFAFFTTGILLSVIALKLKRREDLAEAWDMLREMIFPVNPKVGTFLIRSAFLLSPLVLIYSFLQNSDPLDALLYGLLTFIGVLALPVAWAFIKAQDRAGRRVAQTMVSGQSQEE